MSSQLSTSNLAAREDFIFKLNLFIIGFLLLLLAAWSVAPRVVSPLVQSDAKMSQRINELEFSLQRNPANMQNALELARLYGDVGEFPWSYDALQQAEQNGGQDSMFRLRLGQAYLEIGKNDDAWRVLRQAREQCTPPQCKLDQKVRLDIFTQVALLFKERNIDARKDHGAAEKAFGEILKTVELKPEMLEALKTNKLSHSSSEKVKKASPSLPHKTSSQY